MCKYNIIITMAKLSPRSGCLLALLTSAFGIVIGWIVALIIVHQKEVTSEKLDWLEDAKTYAMFMFFGLCLGASVGMIVAIRNDDKSNDRPPSA